MIPTTFMQSDSLVDNGCTQVKGKSTTNLKQGAANDPRLFRDKFEGHSEAQWLAFSVACLRGERAGNCIPI